LNLKKATAYIQKLKLDKLIEVKAIGGKRQLEINVNQQVLGQLGKLDGCYVIKTDLTDETTNKKEEIHSRYKSLALVEWAFRTEKSQIEIRPVYLRKGHRTKGHLIVCMLAYKIEKYLRECWKELDITVEEGIEKQKKPLCPLRKN
jgi:transposase